MRKIILCFGLSIGVFSTALAEQSPFCGMSDEEMAQFDLQTALAGSWTIKMLEGVKIIDSHVEQLQEKPTRVFLRSRDDGFWLVSEDPGINTELKVNWANSQAWDFNSLKDIPPGTARFYMDETLAVATKCDQPNNLPRLEVSEAVTDEGGRFEVELYLYVTSLDYLYGFMFVKIDEAGTRYNYVISMSR